MTTNTDNRGRSQAHGAAREIHRRGNPHDRYQLHAGDHRHRQRGRPSALWDQRISTIPGATRPLVDELERKLFAGLGASIRVSRIIRGAPGWWLSPESGETAHHVDLVNVVANPGAAFDERNEIVNWFEGVVAHPVRVAIRFDRDGDLEVLATDGVEVFVVDERVPGDRVYRMPSEHTAEDIDLLIGSSPVRSSADYCDPIAAVRNPKVEMAKPKTWTSSNRLAGFLEALAIDCENTDGWEGAASDLREAARYLVAGAPENRLLEAASAVIDAASTTYRTRNGRMGSIEGDDGEQSHIVPFDEFDELAREVQQAMGRAAS